MKIAACFSGQARSFDLGYQYQHHNLFSRYDVDVYIHTWNFARSQELLDLYQPVKYKFEDALAVDCSRYTNTADTTKHPQIATYSMFYSMNESRKLLEGNYDWVVRIRTDWALNVVYDFANLDSSKIYIPYEPHVDYPERDGGNDQFAFGSQENIAKYMSTFENIDRYYDNGTVFIGEQMMQANLREHGLVGDKLEYIDANHPFGPGAYNGTPHSLIRDDRFRW